MTTGGGGQLLTDRTGAAAAAAAAPAPPPPLPTPEVKVTPTAFVFVRVVAAVVVVVALPAAGHAAVVPTPELVRLACPLSCVDKRCMKNKEGLTAPATECQCLLPHSSFGSSDASPQSSSPSHFQRAGMQRPESLQRNSSTPHVIWAGGRETNGRACGHV